MNSSFDSSYPGLKYHIRYYVFANIWLPFKNLKRIQSKTFSPSNLKIIPILKNGRKRKKLVVLDNSISIKEKLIEIEIDPKFTIMIDCDGRSPDSPNLTVWYFYRLIDFLPMLTVDNELFYVFSLKIRSNYRKLFWKLFFKIYSNVNEIYLTDSYLRVELIETFKKHNKGVVNEFKHGIITNEHVGYAHWLTGKCNSELRPDYLIANNKKYDLAEIEDNDLLDMNGINPTNIITESTPKISTVYEISSKKKIVLISQPTMQDYVIELYNDLIKKKYNIAIRPHPKDNYDPHLKLEKELDKEVIYIGWYSTLLVELKTKGYTVYCINGFWNLLSPLIHPDNFLDYEGRSS